jgi:hypothetical protein
MHANRTVGDIFQEFVPMKRILSLSLSVVTCIGLLLATERRAMAYIDPGQGLIAIQSFGAALAATAYFLRSRVLGLFGRNKTGNSTLAAKKPAISVPLPVVVQKGDSRNAA